MMLASITTRLNMLAQAWSPSKNFAALKDNWMGIQSPWLAIFVIFIAMAGLLLVVAALISYRRQSLAAKAKSFRMHGKDLGLNDEELSLLASIARKSKVRNLDAVFNLQEKFSDGLSKMMDANKLEHTIAHPQRTVCANCAFVASLRDKLGFNVMPGDARPTSIQLGPIPKGSTLDITRHRSPESFQVEVVEVTSGPTELIVKSQEDIRCRPGESWLVHFPRGGVLWEFNSWVVRHSEGHVIVRPVGEVRWINRRRFPRVNIERPVWSATFPFERSLDDDPPHFVSGTLLEIAGPGLQICTSLDAQQGDRVLVVLQMDGDKSFESSGIVQRKTNDANGESIFAIELTGLTTAEVAELARQTNIAARHQQHEPTDEGLPVIIGREA